MGTSTERPRGRSRGPCGVAAPGHDRPDVQRRWHVQLASGSRGGGRRHLRPARTRRSPPRTRGWRRRGPRRLRRRPRSWPDLPPKRLALEPVTAAGQRTVDLTDGGRTLLVRLAPAQQVTLELSSTVDPQRIDNSRSDDWLDADQTEQPGSATDSRSGTAIRWSARCRMIRIVHAVKTPLKPRAEGWRGPNAGRRESGRADRSSGRCSRRRSTRRVGAEAASRLLGIDPPSAAQVELSASGESNEPTTCPQRVPPRTVRGRRGRRFRRARRDSPLRHEFGGHPSAETIELHGDGARRFRQFSRSGAPGRSHRRSPATRPHPPQSRASRSPMDDAEFRCRGATSPR